MEFPPKEMRDGKISILATQIVYHSKNVVLLVIQVKKENGSVWEWRVPVFFASFADALQYAKQWIQSFKLIGETL